MNSQFQYRPDIDGLRALAVLSVICFHIGLDDFSGGFVGVDIFFVISGYLITSIVYRELSSGSFRFSTFWIRRARRIFPAATVMMLTTAVVMAAYYPVNYYKDFGNSLIAQSFFSSNFLFWTQGGYFSTALELKPLLHTWSLAVEEQFYLLFPAILWLLYRYLRRLIIPLLFVGTLASLCLSAYASRYYPVPAFFLLPTRAWELSIGSIVAIALANQNSLSNKLMSNIISVVGLICILYSVLYFNDKTPFPSYTALLPVLGTAAIIWASSLSQSFVSRLLAIKPIVGIGLISYSLYLWHWPVIVLKHWVYPEHSTLFHSGIALVLIFVLAFCTYKWIETPIRKNKKLFTDFRVVAMSLLGFCLTVSIGYVASNIGNYRFVDPDHRIDSFYKQARKPEENRPDCINLFRNNTGSITCKYLFRKGTDEIDIFVWGDSHASAAIPTFKLASQILGYNMEYTVSEGCQPVIGMRRIDGFYFCESANKAVMKLIESKNYPAVVLIGSFVNNISRGQFRDVDSPLIYDSANAKQEFSLRFKETVNDIKNTGARALVFTEPPRLPVDPVYEYVRNKTLGLGKAEISVGKNTHLQRIATLYDIIDDSNIDQRLDYTQFFCIESQCRSTLHGESLYKDTGHISVFAAEKLAPLVANDLASGNPESR